MKLLFDTQYDVLRHESCPYSRWHRLILGFCLPVIFQESPLALGRFLLFRSSLPSSFVSIKIGVAAIPSSRLMLLLLSLVFLVSILGAWLVSHHVCPLAYSLQIRYALLFLVPIPALC